MPPSPSLPRPSDRWIPWYIAAFFVVLVSVLVPMAVIAVRTNTGVVTDGAYEKGLAYNKAIEASEQQARLGWKGAITVIPTSDNKVSASFDLQDESGKDIDDAVVKLYLVRPTQAGSDQQIDMKFEGKGHYTAEATLSAKGLWDARIGAMVKDKNFQVTKRIIIP